MNESRDHNSVTSGATGVSWSVRLVVDVAHMDAFEQAFVDLCEVVSLHEVKDGDGKLWCVEGLFAAPPPRAEIAGRVSVVASALGVAEPAIEVVKLEARDWLSENVAAFPPLKAARFYVYGDHIKDPPPPAVLPIRINAATAFGSGEHGSTFGCLLALDWLRRHVKLNAPGRFKALDMGTGSGILALAMAKAWKKPVLAADIDPESVRVTRLNAHKNGVAALVPALMSEGVGDARVRAEGPYRLITANILARPLCAMAAGLTRLLLPGGWLILSGILDRQEAMVTTAYRGQGLKLVRRYRLKPWSTLVFRR